MPNNSVLDIVASTANRDAVRYLIDNKNLGKVCTNLCTKKFYKTNLYQKMSLVFSRSYKNYGVGYSFSASSTQNRLCSKS